MAPGRGSLGPSYAPAGKVLPVRGTSAGLGHYRGLPEVSCSGRGADGGCTGLRVRARACVGGRRGSYAQAGRVLPVGGTSAGRGRYRGLPEVSCSGRGAAGGCTVRVRAGAWVGGRRTVPLRVGQRASGRVAGASQWRQATQSEHQQGHHEKHRGTAGRVGGRPCPRGVAGRRGVDRGRLDCEAAACHAGADASSGTHAHRD